MQLDCPTVVLCLIPDDTIIPAWVPWPCRREFPPGIKGDAPEYRWVCITEDELEKVTRWVGEELNLPYSVDAVTWATGEE